MEDKTKKKNSFDYDLQKIDAKHNLWRIENDLDLIFSYVKIEKNIDTKISLYWLDINLKNIFFPWILKIERELKSYFVYLFKIKFNNDLSNLVNPLNYKKTSFDKNPIDIWKNVDFKQAKTIDELIFSLTFGEFINFFITFNSYFRITISSKINLKEAVFISYLKCILILRNAVAHNKTVIKIKDEKNNKRFSLKKASFDFEISKQEIDIISTNVSGSIFVIKKLLLHFDSPAKAKSFISEIQKGFAKFQKEINNPINYLKIIKLLFLNYFQQILKI